MNSEGAFFGLSEDLFAVKPYDLLASKVALKATEIREMPEGDDYDYQGLAKALNPTGETA